MKHLFFKALLTVLLAWGAAGPGAGPAAAEKTVSRKYAIPQDGSIQMQVPESWRETSTTYEHKLFYTVTFWPRSGDDFKVAVNVNAPAPRKRGPETEASRQRFMEEMLRRTVLPQAEEKEIVSRKFSGAAGFGWLTSLTDKNIKEGEKKPGRYRHVTYGTYLVNGDLLGFEIFSHDREAKAKAQTLEMLKSARKVNP